MRTMKYVKLNMTNMLNGHLLIFIMIVASAVLTSVCLFFSYGLFLNTRELIGMMDNDSLVYDYDIPEVTELPAKIEEFKAELGNDLDHIDLFIRVKDKNGDEIRCGAYSSLDSGEGAANMCRLSDAYEHLIENDRIILDGVAYKPDVVEADKIYRDAAVPLQTITDKAVGTGIMFYTKTQPTADRVDEINLLLKELFGATSVSVPKARSLMDKQINNTFYAYSFIIVMIVAVNLCMYFRYIINSRRKQIKILVICGAGKTQIGVIYLIEAVIELLIGYGIAYIIYDRFLLDRIIAYFPSFTDYYSPELYLTTLLIYLVGSVLVLIMSLVPYVDRLLVGNKGGVSNA